MTFDLNDIKFSHYHTSVDVVDNMLKVSKINKFEENDTNSIVVFEEAMYKNFCYEMDVLAKLREDAPSHARGFIGLIFGCNQEHSKFESFYIRPTNGRDCDDPIRKKHACQYFSYPGYTFSYFREFGIDQYENAISTIALNEWAHIKVIVNDKQAHFYVNDELVLNVERILPIEEGKVGLFVDIGTEGYFKNIKLSHVG